MSRHQIHIGQYTFYEGGSRSQIEWETATKQLLDKGQSFLAYDLAMTGLNSFPDSIKLKQNAALSLIRTGATDTARKILEPLCRQFSADEDTLQNIFSVLRKVVTHLRLDRQDDSLNPEDTQSLNQLLKEVENAGNRMQKTVNPDEETFGLLGRVYKDTWKRTGEHEDAKLSRDTYMRGFKLTNGYFTGINAATMSWIIGDKDTSKVIAETVLCICETKIENAISDEEQYWFLVSMGEACLLLNRENAAIELYEKATKLRDCKPAYIVSSRQQLELLRKNGFSVPKSLFNILKLPTVVIFAGHMIDNSDRPSPRFPFNLEAMVKAEIDSWLDEMDAQIGYCSAACGSDILFIEAMLSRDAEVNIVLPFNMDDYIKTSVQHGGLRWETRFRKALKLAHTVSYVTEEKYLKFDILFDFACQIFQGYAFMRTHLMGTSPYLLAVLDKKSKPLIGGTADIVNKWTDLNKQKIINIENLLERAQKSGFEPEKTLKLDKDIQFDTISNVCSTCKRVLKTMLFADVVGYSKLEEEHVPLFMYEFMEQIAQETGIVKENLCYVNTWGDAIFAVMSSATQMAEYAFLLKDAVFNINTEELGFPDKSKLNIRIALHIGPVFEGIDPVTQKKNFYGSHVNRAARLEPVTVPGCIFASEQFVAKLVTEQIKEHNGDLSKFKYACEYIGSLSLYKNFGPQTVYHIRKKTAVEMGEK